MLLAFATNLDCHMEMASILKYSEKSVLPANDAPTTLATLFKRLNQSVIPFHLILLGSDTSIMKACVRTVGVLFY
jgi:hypothetical protein